MKRYLSYLLISTGADYEQRLRVLIANRLEPTATFRTFAIPGESHTLLGTMDTAVAGGLTLEAWLAQMLTGAASWSSAGLQ
jgi:hypothetical protein